MTPTELGDAWLAAAEAQLHAARTVDAEALVAATAQRAEIQIALAEVVARGNADVRRPLGPIAARVRHLDLRIRACGGAVMAALDTLLPAARPATYTRMARLRDAT